MAELHWTVILSPLNNLWSPICLQVWPLDTIMAKRSNLIGEGDGPTVVVFAHLGIACMVSQVHQLGAEISTGVVNAGLWLEGLLLEAAGALLWGAPHGVSRVRLVPACLFVGKPDVSSPQEKIDEAEDLEGEWRANKGKWSKKTMEKHVIIWKLNLMST